MHCSSHWLHTHVSVHRKNLLQEFVLVALPSIDLSSFLHFLFVSFMHRPFVKTCRFVNQSTSSFGKNERVYNVHWFSLELEARRLPQQLRSAALTSTKETITSLCLAFISLVLPLRQRLSGKNPVCDFARFQTKLASTPPSHIKLIKCGRNYKLMIQSLMLA